MVKMLLRRGLVLSVLLVLCHQFVRWRHFMFEVSHYQLKATFNLLEDEDRMEWGAICNSLQKYSCSEHFFGEVLSKYPNHLKALANHGIALYHLQQHERAIEVFRKYSALGGSGFDAFYYRAQSLIAIERVDSAIYWLYKSVAMNPRFYEATDLLIDQLLQSGKVHEALSLIGFLTQGTPERHGFLKGRLSSIERYVKNLGRAQTKVSQSRLRLPSFDGRSFYLPVRLKSDGPIAFVSLQEELPRMRISKEDYYYLTESVEVLRGPASDLVSDSQQSKISTLESLIVGPWTIKKVPVEFCQECDPTIGSKAMTNMKIEKSLGRSLDFVVLSPLISGE